MGQIWDELLKLLEQTLVFFYQYVGDYGVAIVLLTVVVRVLMLPLTVKQIKSMQDMQKLQPKLKKLQQKYKNDKEKLQQEILKFYSEHKVNPFGGCLPLLLQLPIFFALFRVLLDYKALRGQSTILGISNLSRTPYWFYEQGLAQHWAAAIPYAILLLALVATGYYSSKMMTTDPQSERFMLPMNLFLVVIAVSLPAGVLIYWATTNILTIVQQYFMLKSTKGVEG